MEESPFKGKTGLRRLLNASRNSAAGIRDAFRLEEAFRTELLAAAALIPLAMWLGDTGIERALMAFSVLLVLIVELLNTAIEATVDRVSLDNHPLSKRAKDIASAAVMLTLFNAALMWGLILAQRL